MELLKLWFGNAYNLTVVIFSAKFREKEKGFFSASIYYTNFMIKFIMVDTL